MIIYTLNSIKKEKKELKMYIYWNLSLIKALNLVFSCKYPKGRLWGFKKGDSREAENYQPIPLVPVLSIEQITKER